MKHVIFDLDGVIIDSVSSMRQAFDVALRLAAPTSAPSFADFIGLSGLPLGEIVRSLNLPHTFANDFHEESRRLVDMIEVFPGIKEIFEDLRARHVGMSLFTGKDRVRTVEILRRHNVAHYFESIVTCSDISQGKPNPEGIYRIASVVDIEPAHMVYVGDAPSDIMCAHNAGVPSIGALWGVTDSDTLRACTPSFIVKTPMMLGQLLRGLCGSPFLPTREHLPCE